MDERVVEIGGEQIRLMEAGSGPVLLFLHGAGGAAWTPLLERLSQDWRVVAPEHPGFGTSELPDWMMGMGDLAFFYRRLLRELNLSDVTLVGHSVGGWLAAEIAIRSSERLKRLVLLAPAGIAAKGEPFPDVFLWSAEETARRQFHDPSLAEARITAMAGTDIGIQLQNKAALARLAWNPRLHNPQLPYWLPLIDVPTLLIWGREDRVVPFACHEGYVEALPQAELRVLAESGHGLPVERPDAVADHVMEFSRRAAA